MSWWKSFTDSSNDQDYFQTYAINTFQNLKVKIPNAQVRYLAEEVESLAPSTERIGLASCYQDLANVFSSVQSFLLEEYLHISDLQLGRAQFSRIIRFI